MDKTLSLSKINTVINKKLPKTPNLSNAINNICNKQHDNARKIFVDFVRRVNKHLSSKKNDFCYYF